MPHSIGCRYFWYWGLNPGPHACYSCAPSWSYTPTSWEISSSLSLLAWSLVLHLLEAIRMTSLHGRRWWRGLCVGLCGMCGEERTLNWGLQRKPYCCFSTAWQTTWHPVSCASSQTFVLPYLEGGWWRLIRWSQELNEAMDFNVLCLGDTEIIVTAFLNLWTYRFCEIKF